MKILLALLLLFPSMIFAYENDYFEINVPEELLLVNEKDNIYKWTYDTEDKLPSLSIVVSNNKDYNIDLFTEEDIKSYEAYVKEELNKELEEYDIMVDVYGGKVLEINDMNCLVYYTKWNTKDSFGYDTYQKSYTFTTNKYLISLTFEAKTEEELESEEFKNIVESFKINDNKIKVDNTKNIIYFAIFVITGGLAGFTISAVKNKIRGKKNDK